MSAQPTANPTPTTHPANSAAKHDLILTREANHFRCLWLRGLSKVWEGYLPYIGEHWLRDLHQYDGITSTPPTDRQKRDAHTTLDFPTPAETQQANTNVPRAAVIGGTAPAPIKRVDPSKWEELFHTAEETQNAPPLKFAINGFLQKDGITLIGGLAGHGKTLLMLNMAKALIDGGSLFNYAPFAVEETAKRTVYLVPESGLGPFVHRLKLFGLDKYVGSKFFYRTLSAKEQMALDDARLMRAVEGADVFLDTAVRFMSGDENSAADQRNFAQTLFQLQAAGARTITGAHHAPKNYEQFNSMNLENTLRGSGDIGAMLATCWAVKQKDPTTNRLYLRTVKTRDFESCGPFEIEGRPCIDQTGSFRMSAEPGFAESPKPSVEKLNRTAGHQQEAALMLDGGHTITAIAKHLGVAEKTIYRWKAAGLLTSAGPDVRD